MTATAEEQKADMDTKANSVESHLFRETICVEVEEEDEEDDVDEGVVWSDVVEVVFEGDFMENTRLLANGCI